MTLTARWFVKPAIFLVSLIPFAVITWQALSNNLGPDPVKELSLETGEWALRFLILTLMLTPLRELFKQPEFVRHRRMIGLFALFYATMHLLVWVTFLLEFRWGDMLEEIIERPYVTVGMAAYVILLVLGMTSPKFMLRKLGRNWKRLHRTVYVAAILAVIHLLWILRLDIGEAVIYGAIVAVLLAYRLKGSRLLRRPVDRGRGQN